MMPETHDRQDDQLGRDLEISITLGPDGKVFFSDLTADLLPVAAAIAGQDPQVVLRQLAAREFQKGTK